MGVKLALTFSLSSGGIWATKRSASGSACRSIPPRTPTIESWRLNAVALRITNYFYIYDEVLGPMVMRVGSFLPFQATYYLNGHSFIEQELKKAQVAFRKTASGTHSGSQTERGP